MKPEVPKSWTFEMDYSRAPCPGADQKTCGLWERDCTKSMLLKSSKSLVFDFAILNRFPLFTLEPLFVYALPGVALVPLSGFSNTDF